MNSLESFNTHYNFINENGIPQKKNKHGNCYNFKNPFLDEMKCP